MAVFLAAGAGAGPAEARESGEAAVLQQIFGGTPKKSLFTERFLSAVPLGQLETIVSQVKSQTGEFVRVAGESSPYTLVMSKGTVSVAVSLDTGGKVQGLRILEIMPASGSLEETLGSLDELPGSVSYLIRKNGETIAARNPDTALAVGSTFKLAVLRALRDRIENGGLSWDHTVSLKKEWRSLPTGILQDWPSGSSVTLQTLATLMISVSDNTAADALIDILGRKTIESFAPDSRPLLSTREFFLLKKPENKALRQRYLEAKEEERRRILSRVEGELPPAELFTGDPVAPEIEWFFTVRRLCDLIEELRPLPLTGVNGGPVRTEQWAESAYKGGSEPGVMNMSLSVKDRGGTVYTLSVTQNRDGAALDETSFVTLVQSVLRSLRRERDGSEEEPQQD
jgi:beta-lactamase class A